MSYDNKKIEKKWQEVWKKTGIDITSDKPKKKKFYHLVMFPYPSGDLHMGHWYNYSGADFHARYKKMCGYNIMSPIGFDSFGLPAENAAIKNKTHPKEWTDKNISNMRKQLKSMGCLFDWEREVVTSDPEYYKWTQWMFLFMYKNGLAYKKKVSANWCPKCQTVLANEQVVSGKCERCETEVVKRDIKQWLFKITDYADRLLDDINKLDWPEKTKTMQKNWIGKSEGAEILFKATDIDDKNHDLWVFTTRPDTLFGATFMVLAPEHPLVEKFTTKDQKKKVEDYIQKTSKKKELQRQEDIKDKTGVFTGSYTINPVNNKKIPIWIADYVLMDYGHGAIMAVPAHDQRDWEFAKKYKISTKEVVQPTLASDCIIYGIDPVYTFNSKWKKDFDKLREDENIHLYKKNDLNVFIGEGISIHSDYLNGLDTAMAKEKVINELSKKNLAKKAIDYKLRDWLISRQRYWGVPIPIITCEKCGEVSVSEKDLPVKLPNNVEFQPTGESPLKTSESFVNTKCPKCGGEAKREIDTMDTFVCSSWYYLRYTDPKNKKEFASKEKMKKWLPVDMYIGGAEHTVMHLLYSRFFAKALKDKGYIDFEEPFLTLRHQGTILGSDGQKMSKSKGNAVDPDELVEKHGADAVRLYLGFMGPYDQGGPWNPKGLFGMSRFLNRIWGIFEGKIEDKKLEIEEERVLNKAIKKVTEDISEFKFNTAISALMILINYLVKKETQNKKTLEILSILLAPFAPHFAEELWEKLGNKESIHLQSWPKFDPNLIKDELIILVVQVNGKVRDQIKVSADIKEDEAKKKAQESEKVRKWIEKKKVKKIIYVPKKLVNIVIG